MASAMWCTVNVTPCFKSIMTGRAQDNGGLSSHETVVLGRHISNIYRPFFLPIVVVI